MNSTELEKLLTALRESLVPLIRETVSTQVSVRLDAMAVSLRGEFAAHVEAVTRGVQNQYSVLSAAHDSAVATLVSLSEKYTALNGTVTSQHADTAEQLKSINTGLTATNADVLKNYAEVQDKHQYMLTVTHTISKELHALNDGFGKFKSDVEAVNADLENSVKLYSEVAETRLEEVTRELAGAFNIKQEALQRGLTEAVDRVSEEGRALVTAVRTEILAVSNTNETRCAAQADKIEAVQARCDELHTQSGVVITNLRESTTAAVSKIFENEVRFQNLSDEVGKAHAAMQGRFDNMDGSNASLSESVQQLRQEATDEIVKLDARIADVVHALGVQGAAHSELLSLTTEKFIEVRNSLITVDQRIESATEKAVFTLRPGVVEEAMLGAKQAAEGAITVRFTEAQTLFEASAAKWIENALSGAVESAEAAAEKAAQACLDGVRILDKAAAVETATAAAKEAAQAVCNETIHVVDDKLVKNLETAGVIARNAALEMVDTKHPFIINTAVEKSLATVEPKTAEALEAAHAAAVSAAMGAAGAVAKEMCIGWEDLARQAAHVTARQTALDLVLEKQKDFVDAAVGASMVATHEALAKASETARTAAQETAQTVAAGVATSAAEKAATVAAEALRESLNPAPLVRAAIADAMPRAVDDAVALAVESASEQLSTQLGLSMLTQLQKEIDRLPKPRDGNDGKDGTNGLDGKFNPPQPYQSERQYALNDWVTHDGGVWVAARRVVRSEPGANNDWDCIVPGVKAATAHVLEDGRTAVITLSFTGGATVDHKLRFDVPVARGVYAADQEYQKDDVVTWGGSWFIAQKSGKLGRPEEDSAWKLTIKRGTHGKTPEVKSVPMVQRRGTWESETMYVLNDVVEHAGVHWLCCAASTRLRPPFQTLASNDTWLKLGA